MKTFPSDYFENINFRIRQIILRLELNLIEWNNWIRAWWLSADLTWLSSQLELRILWKIQIFVIELKQVNFNFIGFHVCAHNWFKLARIKYQNETRYWNREWSDFLLPLFSANNNLNFKLPIECVSIANLFNISENLRRRMFWTLELHKDSLRFTLAIKVVNLCVTMKRPWVSTISGYSNRPKGKSGLNKCFSLKKVVKFHVVSLT